MIDDEKVFALAVEGAILGINEVLQSESPGKERLLRELKGDTSEESIRLFAETTMAAKLQAVKEIARRVISKERLTGKDVHAIMEKHKPS